MLKNESQLHLNPVGVQQLRGCVSISVSSFQFHFFPFLFPAFPFAVCKPYKCIAVIS